MPSELDGLLAGAVDAGAVAHAAAIVVDTDGVLYQGQAGPRQLGHEDRPLDADTVYWIHSMTKPLTAAACMQLVEQGRIGLDDDCGALVPALAAPQVLEGFDTDGAPLLRPARGAITLRRLLTHTAGFVYEIWNPDMLRWLQHTGYGRADFYRDPAACPPLAFDPGTRWEYGINIDWAGKVVEAVSGETLETYLHKHILGPLGMETSGYTLTPAVRARLSGVHQRNADGTIHAAEMVLPPVQDPAGFTGGGGMYSTAADYGRFLRMILRGGELDGSRVLAAGTVADMGRDHTGGLPVRPLPAAMPDNTFPMDFYPGIAKRWGLSFMITMVDLPGRRRAGALAWGGLRNTYFWIDPASGIAGALFTQMLPFADPDTLALLDRIEMAVYAARA